MIFYPPEYFFFYIHLGPNYPIVDTELEMPQQHTINIAQHNFQQAFIKELHLKHSNSYIQQWSAEDDLKLLEMGQTCRDWRKLSIDFKGKSQKVCFRRFQKLLKKEKEWPDAVERQIKDLKETGKKSWIQISEILSSKYTENRNLSAKKIRERYKNYLEKDWNRKKWSVEEDLVLYHSVQEYGKDWGIVTKHMEQRTSLQIRNRYYKFIEPILQKIRSKIKKGRRLLEKRQNRQLGQK